MRSVISDQKDFLSFLFLCSNHTLSPPTLSFQPPQDESEDEEEEEVQVGKGEIKDLMVGVYQTLAGEQPEEPAAGSASSELGKHGPLPFCCLSP